MKQKSRRYKRLLNQAKSVINNPYNTLTLLSLVILFVFVVIPLITVLKESLTLAANEAHRVGGVEGRWTIYYWKYIFVSHMSESVLWKPLGHSLLIAFFTCLIAVPLGAGLAWLMVRSNIHFKKVMSFLIVVPYMIPSWCKAMSWLSIFRNERSGCLGLLSGLGITVPDWLAYGPIAIIAVLSLHYYAYSYILVSGALQTINSELEEIGEIQGAKKLQIIRRITLPLVLPAILSALIMTASKAIGTYGASATLGNIVGYSTLATRMYDMLASGSKGTGYVLALLMIELSTVFLFLNQFLIGKRKSYETIGGKGSRSSLSNLGVARTPVSLGVIAFLFVALILPLIILVSETFQKVPGVGFVASNLSTYYWFGRIEDAGLSDLYPGLFRNPDFLGALWNTVKLSLSVAVITAFFGQIFGYLTVRNRNKWHGKIIEQLVFIPYLIPSVAFGAIYLAMFSRTYGNLPSLYGTFTLLVVVSTVKHFPFASRAGSSNMMQISSSLEEAAEIQGSGFVHKMAKIVIPLAKNGFISGFLLVFVSVAKELDLIAILMTEKTRTLSALAFVYKDNAMPQAASAIAVVMVLFIMLVYGISNKLFHTDISKGM